jgi:tRNA threonylcarbamoyladenosine biosynthesis protein TsaB
VRILGFDTATRATTAAIWDSDGHTPAIEGRDDPPPGIRPRHTTRLMELIVEVLERSGTTWVEVDRIAVGVGPGTFTGLRIGVATARALGRAQGIPLVGVSTLQSLALGAAEIGSAGDYRLADGSPPSAPCDAHLAVIDARRGEVFAACWRAGSRPAPEPPQLVLAPRALAPDALAALSPELGSSILAVGEGAIEFRQILEPSGMWIPEDDSGLHKVSAINHCRLASGVRAGNPDEVRPEYLRLPDAEINLRAAAKR